MSSVRPSVNQFNVVVDGADVVEHDRGVLTSTAAAQFFFPLVVRQQFFNASLPSDRQQQFNNQTIKRTISIYYYSGSKNKYFKQ